MATPLGRSALAIIRCSGPNTISLVANICSEKTRIQNSKGFRLIRTQLLRSDSSILDDVLVAVFRAPKSYTGEDSLEIFCHGSPPGIDAILATLFETGFRQARGGEFTLRAFLNGKLDLTRAEAVHDIVSSQSREAHALAMHRLSGAVFNRIEELKHACRDLLAALSIQLDYAEDEVDPFELDTSELQSLLEKTEVLAKSYQLGKRYQEGVRIVLAGKTNAGKSSLFNVIVREDRAIVSSKHGTTRDYLEASLTLGGIPVLLYDTAGLRNSEEEIEAEGIRRSSLVMKTSSVLLYLVDASLGLDDEDRENIRAHLGTGRSSLILFNKVDQLSESQRANLALEESLESESLRIMHISTKDGRGINDLLALLPSLVRGSQMSDDAGLMIDSERQYNLLRKAAGFLSAALEAVDSNFGWDAVAFEIQEAMRAFGEITGEVCNDELLDTMFSNFCVGK